MKLKAVVHETCYPPLRLALQRREFRDLVFERVLKQHLRAKKMGPAEFYVQNCDLADSDPMCESRLTGVSVNIHRSTSDFLAALKELEAIYEETICANYQEGPPLQLMVSIMLDRVPFGLQTNLLESDAVMVPREKRP